VVQAYPLIRGVTSAVALIFSVDVRRGTLVQGTGFSVEPDGYLITSLHVVLPTYMNPQNPLLVMFNDSAYFSRIVCADDMMDIAVLRIDGSGGPLLNSRGEVVGVASFILIRDRVRSMGVSAENVRELLSRCGIK